MHDVRYQDVIQLQHASFRPPSSRQQGRGVRMGMRCRRPLGATVLAAAIFTLGALSGPHVIEHLLGAGGDPDHCAVCAAIHGARAGLSGTGAPPVHVLLLVDLAPPPRQPAIQAVASPVPSSRAPPPVG